MVFDNVVLDDPGKVKLAAGHAEIQLGPGPVNFLPGGEDVTVAGHSGKGSGLACSQKWAPFPEK